MVEATRTGAEVVSGLASDEPAGEEPTAEEPTGEEATGTDGIRDQTLETVMAVGKTVVETETERAGQSVTSGAQLVMVSSLVL
jgi:hypothetical protein